MTTIEIMKQRYSVRKYQARAVEAEKLAQILEAAHVAPSAANLQPVRILVVQSKEGLEKLGKAAALYHAPLALLVCADRSKGMWTPPSLRIT